ncbi:MAG: metallophosphoesterase [Hadesarchaea archaeon]|nr:metallophosphoesterase [Hadesarchaea archaeon]
MVATPVYGTRALTLELEKERALVVADLHLGLEEELATKGIKLPSQIPKIKTRLLRLIRRKKPNKLILLGDVKHNIPITSWQEWRDLPDFFSELTKHVQVEILPGNHDGDIEGLVPRDVIIHDPRGIVIGGEKKIGLMHGHTWPKPELLGADLIITGHNHPAIEFRDDLGGRVIEPVWMYYKILPSNLPKRLQSAVKGEPPRFLVVPAFNELISGAAVNRSIPHELLGPIFKSGCADLPRAEIYLLDGTFLGTLENIKKKNNPRFLP